MTRLRSSFNRESLRQFWQHIATQEYCTWASPYLAYLRTPLGVLSLAAIAALLCGLFVAPQGFVVLAAISAVIGIGCAWPWVGIRGISCQLQFTVPRTEEGQPVDVELVVTNRWPWPVWGLAVEGGFSQFEEGEEHAEIAISRIAGWSRSHFRRPFVPALRGRYPTGKPDLVTEFPFGLWKGRRPIQVASSLTVWPERFSLPPLALTCGSQSWTGQPSESATGSIGHRTTVREYRRGDSMRQIHWAKTALYDKLVSYEREGLVVSDAVVSLDTHPHFHTGVGGQSSVEWTIRIAASICKALLSQGVDLTVLTPASRFRAVSRSNDLTKLLDWFALLEVRDDSVPRSNFSSQSARHSNRLSVHVTTDLSPSCSGDSIVYLTEPERSDSARNAHVSRSWITVRKDADVATQVRNRWQNGPRSVRYAV